MSPPRPPTEPSARFPGYLVVCSHRMTALGHFMARVEIRRERDGRRICPFEGWLPPGPFETREQANREAGQLAALLVAADIANPET